MVPLCIAFAPLSLRGVGPFPVLENAPFLWGALLCLQDLLYKSTVSLTGALGANLTQMVDLNSVHVWFSLKYWASEGISEKKGFLRRWFRHSKLWGCHACRSALRSSGWNLITQRARANVHWRLALFVGGWQRVVFQKGGFGGCSPERKPERGYIRMFPRNENQNEGTFACSPGTKTGTRAHSPKPPFYETTLLSPNGFWSLVSSSQTLLRLRWLGSR